MTDEKRPGEGPELDADVEAQFLKESLGAGLAAAAIFAGSSQAGSYPVPSPPGAAADVAAERTLISTKGEATRAIRQAKPRAKAPKAIKAMKASKAKKAAAGRAAAGGRAPLQ